MQALLNFCLLLFCVWGFSLRAQETFSISEASRGELGEFVHTVQSSYQSAATEIRVLQPEKLKRDTKYRVIYLLPVEAGIENRYGNAIDEVKRLDLHNAHDLIFVAPTFAQLPWYADHPFDPAIRQESHFLKVVVPFIDKSYPVQPEASGRYLLGFSKSGWGAWSLLLRHQEIFSRAAAWDAPLMMDQSGKYGSGPIFGTPENFANYQISKLLEANAPRLQAEKRLILLGYGSFRAEHVRLHELMEQWRIAHQYRDGPKRPHDWHSGWVKDAVELLSL
jgi:hypothetical protein